MIENIKKILAVYVSVTLVAVLMGCASNKIAHSTASTYAIDGREMNVIINDAISGDSVSSEKAGNHYFYIEQNFEEALFWYRLAVEQGSAEAVFRLSTTLKLLGKMQLAITALEGLDDEGPYSLEKYKALGDLYLEFGQSEKSLRNYCVSGLLGDRYSSGKVFDIYFNHFGGDISISYYWANYLLKLTEKNTFAYEEVEKNIGNLEAPVDNLDVLDAVRRSVSRETQLTNVQTFCAHWDKQYPYQRSGNGKGG